MTTHDQFGGPRELDDSNDIFGRFEQDVNELIGDRIRASDKDAEALWVSLANTNWYHEDDFPDEHVSYSFRAAGSFIAAIRAKGNYMDWYCCRFDYGNVAEWIADALATKGWDHSG